MGPCDRGNSRKRNHDALKEAEHPSRLEDTGKTHAGIKTDTRKSKRIKLSARGLELLAALSWKRISITDIEFSEKSSKDGGTFADVVAATLIARSRTWIWMTRRRVAVKKLRVIGDMTEERLFCAFVNELRVLDRLGHPNIVEIIGFVEDIQNRIAWLVFRWEENGNLRKFLGSGTWELPERVSLIADVTAGLEYLHTRQPPIRHGDLKSLNILVNSFNRAVITDFGSARIIELGATSAPNIPSRGNETAELKLTVANSTLTLTGPACSARWAPPEYLNENPLDLASDIWALSWIAWEAITDNFPFEEVDSVVDVTMRVLDGRLPRIYDHHQLSQVQNLCGIMQKCWKLDPRARPSATDCKKAIGWIPKAIPLRKDGKQSTTPSAPLLLQMGQIHSFQCQWKEALGKFERGLAMARSTGEQATLADLLLRIAEIHRMGSKYVEAEASYAEVLGICKTTGDDVGRANALWGLGDVRSEQSKYIEAEASFAEALAIYKTMGRDVGRANALRGLGDVRRAQSKYIEAEASYREALAIYKIIGDDLGRANALRGLGDVRKAQSKYIEAEVSYDEVLGICKTTGEDVGRANALQGLGDVRRAQSKYIEAEASYREALAIYKTIGLDLGRANALRGLGEVWREQSKYIEAEAPFAEALVIYETIGSDLGRANALEGLGDLRRAQSKYIEAEASYADALAIYKTTGCDLGQANALEGLGTVHRAQSKYTEAEASYADALTIHEQIGHDLGRVNCFLGLAEIWIHQARYAEAKSLVDDGASISDRVDYAWGISTSAKLLDKILEAESPSNILTSALPTSTHTEDSAPLTPLPETDGSSGALP